MSKPNAQKKILDVAANLSVRSPGAAISREKVKTLASIKGKSTFANSLTKLKKAELILLPPKQIIVTSKGMKVADINAAGIPKTNKELHDIIKNEHKLNASQIALFNHLADGDTYNKKQVKEALGIKGTSTWANLMTKVKKLGIIEYVDRETIKLTDPMFEAEGRPAN